MQALMHTHPLVAVNDVEQSQVVYVPFTTTEVQNWQEFLPCLIDNAENLNSYLIHTNIPTWANCNVQLEKMLNMDKRRFVSEAVAKLLQNQNHSYQHRNQTGIVWKKLNKWLLGT